LKRAALDKVQRELLTPYGLRTLAPSHPAYKGVFTGPPYERDRAYVKLHGSDRKAGLQAAEWIQPLLDHLTQDGCLGGLCEVFDGDEPIRPKG
jgi:glycogen debranching enzyme